MLPATFETVYGLVKISEQRLYFQDFKKLLDFVHDFMNTEYFDLVDMVINTRYNSIDFYTKKDLKENWIIFLYGFLKKLSYGESYEQLRNMHIV